MAPVITTYWHPNNGALEGAGVTNSSAVQLEWWCTCWKHSMLLTTKQLVGGHPNGIECKVCAMEADSLLELVVRWALVGMGVPFMVYPRVLGGSYGSADLYVQQANLIIAVDGPGHVSEGCKSVSLWRQQEVDERWNDECMRQGRRVLRLHHMDIEMRDSAIYCKLALDICKKHPNHPFILYSKRYTLPPLCYKHRGL